MNLSDQKIIVTGCANGIGEALCKALSSHGSQVLGLDYCAPHDELLKVFNFEFQQQDLTAPNMSEAWSKILTSFDPDIIVHSAGRGSMGDYGDIPLDQERAMIDLNVGATMTLVHTAVNTLSDDRARHIILLSSLAGISCVPGMATYSATKHFVSGLANSVNEELRIRGRNMKISTLTPPPVRTKFRENMGYEERDKKISGVLRPTDVAKDILYVMRHPQQSRITGFRHRLLNRIMPLIPKRFLYRKIYEISMHDLQPLKK